MTQNLLKFLCLFALNIGIVFCGKAQTASNDAAVSLLVSPSSSSTLSFCPGLYDIKIKVKNYGNNVINNLTVNWQLNAVNQVPYSLTLPLDIVGGVGINEREITLGNYNFTSAPVNLKVWTTLPNSQSDTINTNDTLSAVLKSALSGIYTINGAAAASGTNYQTITAFVTDLNIRGVCGPVVANVNASSGAYYGNIYLGDVAGTSAVNTVRINGNGSTVQYDCNATNRQLIRLLGTKYVTIDSINFISQGSSYAWGAVINGGAAYDSITRCTFDLTVNTSTAAETTSGFCFSGSITSNTTSGANATHCYIGGNTVQGPSSVGGCYYAVTMMDGADSNMLEMNKFFDFYRYGIYLSGAKNNLIKGNEVARPNKTEVSTFYGIYTTQAIDGTQIIGNRIHTPGGVAASPSGTNYGMYLLGTSTVSNPVLVANNIVYDMNQAGAMYGLYLSSATNNKVYHNTITLDKILTGITINSAIRLAGTNTGLEIKNNIISITGGNLGEKYGISAQPATAFTSIADEQRNNIYINTPQAGGAFCVGIGTSSASPLFYSTMTAFQAANPTLEVGSINVNPQFVNAATANFMPQNTALISNGLNLSTVVSDDITGTLRNSLPTPGAYEIISSGINAGIANLVSPSAPFCANQQAVKVAVVNAGTVALSNFQVNWTLNNVAQLPYTYAGSLAVNAVDTITLGTVNIPAGSNNIKVWTVAAGDVNAANDTLSATVSPTAFTIAAFDDTLCVGANGIVILTPTTGYASGMIQWQASADGTTFANIPNADTAIWVESNMTAGKWFRAMINSGSAGCYSNVANITTVNPQILSGTPAVRCGAGSVTLTASATPGAVLSWYTAATGGTPLFIGASFVTPSIAATTTYYVDATMGACTSVRMPVLATVNANPVVSLGNDTSYCVAASVTLTANSVATTFLWDNGSTAATRMINAAGTYYVQVTDGNNCMGYDTITVTENALPVVNLGNDAEICNGATLVLDAGNAGSAYVWDNAATAQTRTVNGAGTYSVHVTDVNGCNGYDTVLVTVIPPPGGVMNITNVSGSTYSFSISNPQNVLSSQWSFGDQSPISTSQSVNHTYTASGNFIVTLTLIGVCDTVVLTDTIQTSLGVGDVNIDNDVLSLYPNPTYNNVIIETRQNYAIKEVIVYNVLGQTLMHENAQDGNKYKLDLGRLSSGIYNVKIVTDKGNVVRKVNLLK